ncbi:transglutaminaseTgpA domain-containing protein [Ketobacter sp.]|uniref:transglutaminase family protein n=1 Tax=Ketobacter sp. TaxID=2083498 RepID=UPI000F114FCC|nr:transglutaminaseTgpA domain-containing protein [Ketobacter sp.]RLT98640.1 MAG: DUF3488 domain-containing protein [Ketobacter sp.]
MADSRHPPVFPMPRTAFVLLMVSVTLAVLPHVQRVPPWLLAVFGIVLVWRIQVFRQRLRFPPKWARLFMVCGGVLGVVYYHGTIFGPDAGVALLISAYLFKQLEMYTRRDAFLIIILSFFVLATEFLFSTSLFTSLYVFVVLVVITAALIALNMTDTSIALWRPMRAAFVTVLQAVPLLLVFFFLFPRIGPIWDLGMKSTIARTGLSDRMTPGDVADLSQSAKLAFRIEFEGEIPAPRDRYWRALIFDRFDGKTWSAQGDPQSIPFSPNRLNVNGEALRYRVLLEPTGNNWLPAMPWSQLSGVKHRTSNGLVHYAINVVDSAISYQVETFPDYQYETEGMPRDMWGVYTTLPPLGNARTYALAKDLYRRTGRNPERMTASILRWFNEERFIYTLKPPKLGSDSMDDFLFGTRKGFCAHYAGAFVFMMRAAGIPARMIGGYQGGEAHPIGKYLLVHQYDAHAWAEYWVNGKGWVRVDPTAAIAPERIEMGSLRDSLDELSLLDSPFSKMGLRNLPFMSELRLMIDYVDYLWFKNVVSFDSGVQHKLLQRILGEVTPQRIAMLLGVCGGVVVLGLGLWMVLSQRRLLELDLADKLYLRFQRKLSQAGLQRETGEGVMSFSLRVQQRFPDQSDTINKISCLYSNIKYSNRSEKRDTDKKLTSESDSIAALNQAIKNLKL